MKRARELGDTEVIRRKNRFEVQRTYYKGRWGNYLHKDFPEPDSNESNTRTTEVPRENVAQARPASPPTESKHQSKRSRTESDTASHVELEELWNSDMKPDSEPREIILDGSVSPHQHANMSEVRRVTSIDQFDITSENI